MMTSAHAKLALTSSSLFSAFHSHRRQPKSNLSIIRSRPPRRPVTTLTRYTTPTTAAVAIDGSKGTGDIPFELDVVDFHHVEFWCADAASAAGRFSFGLGVPFAALSGITTGNAAHASYALRSSTGTLGFLFSAPYGQHYTAAGGATVPSFCADTARRFTADHGLAVRALAVRVADAAEAFSASVNAGARPAFRPADLGHGFVMAEVELFGDAVLRFVSYADEDAAGVAFLPGFQGMASPGSPPDFGLTRFDHIACGVPDLASVASHVAGFTGFHEFSNFTGDKVVTAESGLNGLVLSDSADSVLLTFLEPVRGTKRRSQVQTFLDHHGGPGVQHLAMASDDLLGTLRKIQARSSVGGFELLPPPPASYYDGVRQHAGHVLSQEQIDECQELGVMVDTDESGGLVLQIFTKAAVDRPTLLLEFVQRIGSGEERKEYKSGAYGGFPEGNVGHLFKSIEDYDKSFDTIAPAASKEDKMPLAI